jgi:hypothetical protein
VFGHSHEDRQFLGRIDPEFIWTLCNYKGVFEYIQAGRQSGADVVGYLVTDDPVLFADRNTRFAIGWDTIDWECLNEGTAPVPVHQQPEQESPQEVPASPALVFRPVEHMLGKVFRKPFPISDHGQPDAIHEGRKNFRPLDRGESPSPGFSAGPEREAVATVSEDTLPVHPSDTLSREVDQPTTVAPQSSRQPRPQRPKPLNMPKSLPIPSMAPPETPAPDPKPKQHSVQPADMQLPVTQEVKPDPIPLSSAPPPETPAPDPKPKVAPVSQKPRKTVTRYLPIGRDQARLDLACFGVWPRSTPCTHCRGTGFLADVHRGQLECDRCDGRGWNPAPDDPLEYQVVLA